MHSMTIDLKAGVAVMAICASSFAGGAAPQAKLPKQDPEVLHFVQRAAPWYPDSTFTIVNDKRVMTASGSYRLIAVKRTCANRYLTGVRGWVIDEVTKTMWAGTVGTLPDVPQASADLNGFLKSFLPGALRRSLRMTATVVWKTGGRPSGALIPFLLKIDSGYGSYFKPAAVTADGRRIVLGTPYPLGQDPVAYRKKLLEKNPLVMWDHPGHDAKVEIVEFSDFECPACKARWPLIAKTLKRFDGAIRHGMVNFPLTMIHPWSFRAASAAWCVASQDPTKLIPLKEQFYSMQQEMEVSQVRPVARDFVAGNGLNEKAFASCFLEKPSLDAVNRQIGLSQDLGVMATPTYFVNGWQVQMPAKDWFLPMIQRLVAGQEP
jgi:protein-disulfide isomerase